MSQNSQDNDIALSVLFHASKFLSGKLRRFIPLYGDDICQLSLKTDHFGKYFNVYVAKFIKLSYYKANKINTELALLLRNKNLDKNGVKYDGLYTRL